MKRLFDIVVAFGALVCLFPLLVIAAVLIKMDSPGPILFKQERIGRRFRPFRILKFRTMMHGSPAVGRSITAGDDPRITRVGWFLRKSKIDELPQLINVLKGEMTFVGPRPEVPQYVEMFREDYNEILKVRPGITDLASLKYRDEAALLGLSADPEAEYVGHVLPDKINLGKEYIKRSSFCFDFMLILKTLRRII